jgi:asparagine synthase (glutamine-hydrolysing)
MCGIAGILDTPASTSVEQLGRFAAAMSGTLRHRGPDDEGVWVDAPSGIALGHRRLAIIDLSVEGHQPMASSDGRWVLNFNGEIYNHGELRSRLASGGHGFRGHSDTEVLVEAIAAWGLDRTLTATNGMFAFAAWDSHDRRLHLVRDRLGEKPLYFGWAGSRFVFGSELKALRAAPDFDPDIDRDVLALYLRLGYVPAPHCIYRRVWKLNAGCRISVDRTTPVGCDVEQSSWWSLLGVIEGSPRRPAVDATTVDEVEALLADAVGLRMQADVPLGAFLSGGIDSSTVVALMLARAPGRVRTFTVGFGDAAYDETADASAVARHLGTDHTEIRLTPADALGAVTRLPDVYDEPFADPSQLPTLLVSEAARRHVTVSLSGDGGDEVFGGYNRYVLGDLAWRRARRIPVSVRRAAARTLLSASPHAWDRVIGAAERALPDRLRVRNPGDKLHKLAAALGAGTPADLLRRLVSQWDQPNAIVKGGTEATTMLDASSSLAMATVAEQMMCLDTMMTLPDQMLAKVDRASMAASLEVRVPLIDHRIVELMWSLPIEARIRDGRGKWLLRQVLSRHLPHELIDRPKMGFDFPIARWLRGPLRAWSDDLLDGTRLAADGYLEAGPIGDRWREHLSGRRNWDYSLWTILMFEAWLERQPR